MTVLVTYDASLCATPMAVVPHVLEAQLRAVVGGKLEGGADAGVGVSEDMDPLHRTQGEEIHVTYTEALTPVEAAAAESVVLAHSSEDSIPSQTLVTSTEPTGEIPPGARCLIDTSGGPAERTFPRVRDAKDMIVMHCKGVNDMTLKPHPSEQGTVTVDGGAFSTMGDGEAAVYGVDQSGGWINLGPKGFD